MDNTVQRSERLPLIDALRAFALFGILQVNIQSFVWGGAQPLGFLQPGAHGADSAAYLLVATLVSTKFMALFAFLFGFGFVLQMRSLGSAQRYRKRLWFLLAVGLAHGCLMYFGDVLAMYALCGFILVLYADVRPAKLARVLKWWWLAFVVVVGGILGGAALLSSSADGAVAVTEIPQEVLSQHSVYTTAGFADQIATRSQEYLVGLLAGTVFAGPMVISLFLLGALAARQGWLRHPERHPKVWRMASRIGAVGLVLATVGAVLMYLAQLESPGGYDFIGIALTTASLTAMALYVACIVRYRHTPVVHRAIHWLAPAGRMPLTNYLLQSVLMGGLLSGWGWGLGATLGRAELALLALGIALAQIMLSRVWIAHFTAGPMETLWRRATYSRQ